MVVTELSTRTTQAAQHDEQIHLLRKEETWNIQDSLDSSRSLKYDQSFNRFEVQTIIWVMAYVLWCAARPRATSQEPPPPAASACAMRRRLVAWRNPLAARARPHRAKILARNAGRSVLAGPSEASDKLQREGGLKLSEACAKRPAETRVWNSKTSHHANSTWLNCLVPVGRRAVLWF